MKLESQVSNLELSKRLRELGVKQESEFWWVAQRDSTFELVSDETCQRTIAQIKGEYPEADLSWETSYFSAFTVAELGEMLPGVIETENAAYANPKHPNKGMRNGYYILSCGRNDPRSKVKYFDVDYADKNVPDDVLRIHTEMADTEADARAKMLIYLIENKLITLNK